MEKHKAYIFTIELEGAGDTPDEAWENVINSFPRDLGSTPQEYRIDYQE